MKEIQNKLLEMKKKIIDEIEEERIKSMASVTDDIGDDIDHANEERNRELFQLLCDRDKSKLQLIEKALNRIADNNYGICEECEKKINKKRLLAMPFARLCIECKSEEERTKGTVQSSSFKDPLYNIPEKGEEEESRFT